MEPSVFISVGALLVAASGLAWKFGAHSNNGKVDHGQMRGALTSYREKKDCMDHMGKVDTAMVALNSKVDAHTDVLAKINGAVQYMRGKAEAADR